MSGIRTAIVDDEGPGCERLRLLLDREPDIEITAEFGCGAAAVDGLRQAMPDLLLLDIQMPDMNGFEVLQALEGQAALPLVIFVTAHAQHALDAFDARAIDYLLKPVLPSRFRQAIQGVRDRLKTTAHPLAATRPRRTPGAAAEHPPGCLIRFAVRNKGSTDFLPVAAVDWIESAGNYAVLNCGAASHLIRETMMSIESQLPPGGFVRVSRSVLANCASIVKLNVLDDGTCELVLRSGKRLVVTRGQREIERLLKYA